MLKRNYNPLKLENEHVPMPLSKEISEQIHLAIGSCLESLHNCQLTAFTKEWVGQSTFWLGENMARKVKLEKLLNANFISN